MFSAAAATNKSESSQPLPGLEKRKPRVVFLDVIRGLAALCVLLQHTTEESTSFSATDRPYLYWSFHWFNLGRVGVAAFFLVSGFVIPYSLERVNSLRSFWVSRIFRLYPLFWFSLLLVVAFHFLGNDVMMRDYPPQVWQWKKVLLINVTMLQQFVPPVVARHLVIGGNHVPNAIGLYWTLTLELVFYVLFSTLFALGINKRTLTFAWLGLFVMLASAVAGMILHRKLPVSDVGLLSLALLGTAAFRYYSGHISRAQLSLLAVGASIIFAIAFGLGFASPFKTPPTSEVWTSLSMYTSYAGGALLFAIVFRFRASDFAFPLRWLGMISYSVYLLHYPCWLCLMWIPHHGALSAPLWQLAVFSLTCLVASATYLLVERPAVELGKRLLHMPKPATELGRPIDAMSPIGHVRMVTGS